MKSREERAAQSIDGWHAWGTVWGHASRAEIAVLDLIDSSEKHFARVYHMVGYAQSSIWLATNRPGAVARLAAQGYTVAAAFGPWRDALLID